MNARLKRSTVGLASMLVLYLVYELVGVPLIEPRAPSREQTLASAEELEAAREEVSRRYFELFAAWFPEDHWTRKNPKVLENDRAMLLIKDYRRLEDGRVELVPCVVFFFPQARNDYNALPRDAILLDAPQGAVLQFEDGFDLAQAKIGKLTYGKLAGALTIRSDMREPGGEDDLLITTRDVELTESRVWTRSEVDFRQGNNRGRGSGMEIRLLPGPESPGGRSRGMNIGGLQSFELSHQVKMNLAAVHADFLPRSSGQGNADTAPSKTAADKTRVAGAPVEIVCQGPFHFNLVNQVATFENDVDVVRILPNGPSDQMSCDLLAVHFEKKKEDKASAKAAEKTDARRKLPALEPVRIEARGNPVDVRSPSSSAQVRCQQLVYDLKTRQIEVEGDEQLLLTHGANQIHAPKLRYQPGATADDLGTATATGPGWLRATPQANPERTFEARWNESLQMRPHDGLHLISLRGNPHLHMAEVGTLQAGEVHLWLRPAGQREGEPGDSSSRTHPDRLLASENVRIESPQLKADTQRLEVWFQETEVPPGDASADAKPASSTGMGALVPVRPKTAATSRSGTPQAVSPAAPPEPAGPTHEIRGELIRLQIVLNGQKSEVSDVTVEGDVQFSETRTAPSGQQPLKIVGDRLQVSEADRPSTQVAVSGRPAHVEARGMQMKGGVIQLDRGTNRLWIDSAGTMTLPAAQGFPGQLAPVANPQQARTFTVDWQGTMNFDGRLARFERSVVGRGEGQVLRTELLEVGLKQRINFGSEATAANNAQVETVACREGAWLENRSMSDGQTTSIDRMQARTLTLNQVTGDLTGEGPGWITTVRRAGAQPLGGALATPSPVTSIAPAPKEAPPAAGAFEPPKFEYLRVDFRGGLEGNTQRREMTLLGGVRSIYGPVAGWDEIVDPLDPDALGESGILLDCDRLTVSEMKVPFRTQGAMELQAVGNTRMEGRAFTAHADRLTYAQSKELFVLEGTGRSDAELWRQERVGGQPSHAAARRILYWRSTNRVEVDDARFLDLGQIGSDKASTQPKPADKPR